MSDNDFEFEEEIHTNLDSSPVESPPPPRSRALSSFAAPISSETAEQYLISCCLLDGAAIVAKCAGAGVTRDSFFNDANATIFDRLVDLARRQVPIDVGVLAEDLRAKRLLEQVGGYAHVTQVSSLIPTTAQAGFYIEKVREAHARRQLQTLAARTAEHAREGLDLGEVLAELEAGVGKVGKLAREGRVIPIRKASEFRYPHGDDPNVLLGTDDYLGRGGGMLFVSHAGAGKSSFIMDACVSWAVGLPWVQIRSNGALRILVVQGEDSDRYVGKVIESYRQMGKLTAEQLEVLDRNLHIVHLRGVSGPEFLGELAQLVDQVQPDLVVINPIYMYADGDISKSESAQPFLVGLDRVNRNARFGYILVHHTGKPAARGPNGKRAELEDWETIYQGFGSSYLANWPRCSALLEPRPGSERGRYVLKLGKAGFNAGVTKRVEQGAGWRDEPVTRVALKHSTGKIKVEGVDRSAIYWEVDEDEPTDQEDGQEKKEGKAGGRPPTFTFNEFKAAFAKIATGREKRANYNTLYRKANEVMALSKGAFNRVISEAIDVGVLIKDADDGRYYLPVDPRAV